MKFYLDGVLYYLNRIIWNVLCDFSDWLSNAVQSYFDWFTDRFGMFPDVKDKWFD